VAVVGRGGTTSPTDRQRDEVTYRVAAACIAHGADVVAGRQRRREVAAVAMKLETDKWAPTFFLFKKIFKHPHFDI
jgi:hypothetical protein